MRATAQRTWNGAIRDRTVHDIAVGNTGVRSMLGNYLQRAIDEIRVARSELPIFGAAGVRDFGTVQEALEALLDALQDVDRRLSSLEEKVSVDEESTTNHH